MEGVSYEEVAKSGFIRNWNVVDDMAINLWK